MSADIREAVATALAAQQDEPLLYTVGAAARKLSLSERTVYRLIDSGRLRPVNVGDGRSKTRIRHDDLLAFIDKSTVK